MQKIIVLGGTGYIGSEVVRELIQKHPKLVIKSVVRSEESAAKIKSMGAQPIMGDLLVPGEWNDELQTADYIIHAAQPKVFNRRITSKSVSDIVLNRKIMDENILEPLDPDQKQRIIYVSGNSFFGETGTAGKKDETMEPKPTGFGPYIMDLVNSLDNYRKKGFQIITVFPAAVYGNGAWLKQFVLDRISAGKSIMTYRGESHYISPIHVQDCARAIVYLLSVSETKLKRSGYKYLIVDDKPVTADEMNRIIAQSMGKELKYTKLPHWMLKLFMGDIFYSYMMTDSMYSNKKLKSLGFNLKFPTIEEGIPDIVKQTQN